MYVGCKQRIVFVSVNSQCNIQDITNHYILRWGLLYLNSDHSQLVDNFLFYKVWYMKKLILLIDYQRVSLIINTRLARLQRISICQPRLWDIKKPQDSYWCPKIIITKTYMFLKYYCCSSPGRTVVLSMLPHILKVWPS